MSVTILPDKAQCDAAIKRLVDSNSGIKAAMIATRDGRAFMGRGSTAVDSGKFAAMVSSMVALGNTFLRELKSGPLDHVLIEGANGKLVISSIVGSDELLVLAVLAENDARLGMVLSSSKTCSQDVSKAFPSAAS